MPQVGQKSAKGALGLLLVLTLASFPSQDAWSGGSPFSGGRVKVIAAHMPSSKGAQEPTAGLSRRTVSERDAITMQVISGPGASSNYGGTLTRDFAIYSSDGSKFVIILRRGNLRNNTNEYSMLLYRADRLFQSTGPTLLVRMSSSSNREAIKDVRWLDDNNTILFLGENPGERSQLYSVSCRTRVLKKLTNHPTNIVAFSTDATGRILVYAAQKPAKRIATGQALRYGIQVTNQAMADLVAGRIQDDEWDLFVLRTGSRPRPLLIPDALRGKLWGESGEMSLSPDGRNLVVKLNLTEVPTEWIAYPDKWVHRGITQYRAPGALSWIFGYGIVSLQTGRGRILLDSPVGYSESRVRWAPNSRSVAISGVYLPLSPRPELPGEIGESKTWIVEIDIATLRYSAVKPEPWALIGWDRQGLLLNRADSEPEGTSLPRVFKDQNGSWAEVERQGTNHSQLPQIVAEQDLNTPPHIVAVDPTRRRRRVLMELNAQFSNLTLGRVERLNFKGADNRDIQAGLYFPPDYVPGKEYPLIIQTHGFDPESFWIDGPYPTAFAAQALAASGMLVLQLPSSHDWVGTPEEGPKMVETFAAAIACVESEAMVDKDRIGIVGFSRTGFHVLYALTHSALPFSAAVVADGSDGGYSQYLQFLNASPYTASDSEGLNGGLPFGTAIRTWAERSPEFSLDRVRCPLLIQALNPRSLTFQWATFAGLKRLGKPVDLLYLPNATHILQRPWDRLVSQQGTVDWFRFWFLGREDANPAKAKRYMRWRELENSQAMTSPTGR